MWYDNTKRQRGVSTAQPWYYTMPKNLKFKNQNNCFSQGYKENLEYLNGET